MDELVDIVARLRGPDGCPWDRAQTPQSVSKYVLEEAFEVAHAIDHGDDDAVRNELGDLIFLVALLARMAEERGAFTMDDVLSTVAGKMISRHPHVFGESAGVPAAPGQWEALKAQERGPEASALDGVPRALPAALRAHRVTEKAAAVGFDWEDAQGPRDKLDEELAELDAALEGGEEAAITHELGDVLLSVVNLGRHVPGPGAEDALRLATDRFARRFERVEQLAREAGTTPHDADMHTLEAWWQQAKAEGA